ncbi:hypothetical protein GXN76_09150 [Kroppenstedtia pulmonis]|uniref:pPIWI-RE three-gene island domain-containing protein n=1 Tax=Kroppenstedtia pulmonis TaxID=1380685 RepID=A0A7D4B2P6_9BACL|nr:hypothetical protein [Kroppenstedtia pulmonis]QKG84626.1 hypothetical protein GXN76_09150 [Kroppenstedtia pulmonis]
MSRLTLFQLCKQKSREGYFDALPLGDTGKVPHRRKRFIEVEFTLYGGYFSGLHDLPASDLWAALKGWEDIVLTKEMDVDRIRRLRLLVLPFQSKATWEDALSFYRTIEERYRLFTFDESGMMKLRSNLPVCSDRPQLYEQILSSAIPRKKRKVRLARPYKEYRYDRGETKDVYTVKIPSVSSSPLSKNKTIRKKKSLTIPADFDWVQVGMEMDQIRKDNGREPVDYAGRMKDMTVKPLSGDEKQPMKFIKSTHILGGLGAGKSTWMVAATYELVRKGAKVGFIESSVANILKRAEELRSLRLSVATIIGTSQRSDHEREYLDRPGLTLDEIAQDSSLSDLSSLCLIEALANDETINSQYPCQKLYKPKNKDKYYACPMASQCGLYQQLATLEQADVWIATPASLVSSRIPPQLHLDHLTFYEAFYEALDVVFVDEADALQENFDQAFIQDENLFGDRGHLIENTIRDIRNSLHGLYEPGGQFLTQYLRQCDTTLDATRCMFQLIKEHPKIQNYLRSHVSFKFQWQFKVINSLEKWGSSPEIIAFTSILESWNPDLSEDPLRGQDRTKSPDPAWFQKTEDFLDEKIDLQELLNLKPTTSAQKTELRNIAAECRFYLWLCRLESSLKFITDRYPELLSFVDDLKIRLPYSAAKNSLLPYLPTPTLGYRYGYRLVQEEDSEQLIMKLIEYNTIGRLLLYRFPDLFEAVGDGPGPAVILLSGTTLTPRNAHFSLPVSPDWLITSSNKASTIAQEFLPLSDQTGRPIRVSGMKPFDRKLALKNMARQLPSIMEAEKTYWKQQRGVLLVTNSYHDSETIVEAFSCSPSQLQIKSLSRNVKDAKLHVTRPRLTEIANNVDALITPLSAMNRGVNLVDENRKALFGTALFLSRPYPPPQDISYILSFIHSRLPHLIQQVREQNMSGKKALSYFREICHSIFSRMHDKPNFWKSLDKEERLDLAWYLFVPIWQMAGRLVRGGVPARLLYIDSSYETDSAISLFEVWYQLFEPHQDHWLYQELYGPFLSSLENLVQQEKSEKEVEMNGL